VNGSFLPVRPSHRNSSPRRRRIVAFEPFREVTTWVRALLLSRADGHGEVALLSSRAARPLVARSEYPAEHPVRIRSRLVTGRTSDAGRED